MTTAMQRTEFDLRPAIVPFGFGAGSKTETVLTVADESIFICGTDDCDYSAEKYSQVMAHRSKHGRARRAGRKPVTAEGKINSLKAEALALAEKIEALAEHPGEKVVSATAYQNMRNRALRAERELVEHQRTFARLAGFTPAE